MDNTRVRFEDTGLWLRIHLLGTFQAGTVDLIAVPVNQYWELQYISTNGLALKSPEFVVRHNEYLLVVIGKEGFGQELFDGSSVALPGERLSLSVKSEGKLECTIVFRRKLIREHPIELPIEPEPQHHVNAVRVGGELELDVFSGDPTDVGVK